ncbi:MAG: response regulator [Pseudomonadota bacterium]
MDVLIVEPNADLAALWQRHLEREGCRVEAVTAYQDAMNILRMRAFKAVIIDLKLPEVAVFSLSDFAIYRNSDVSIITVSPDRFFSDGAIFDMIPNVRSHLQTTLDPADLAAVVGHYSRAR